MLEASRSLNAALDRIQSSKEASSSPSSNSGSSSSQDPDQDENLTQELIAAARKSQDSLLQAYVHQMEQEVHKGEWTVEEMRTCLLLFLDTDSGKSSKLLHAFQELKGCSKGSSGNGNGPNDDHLGVGMDMDIGIPLDDIDHDHHQGGESSSSAKAAKTSSSSSSAVEQLELDRDGIMKLFRCFLLSISTCIHYDDAHSSKQQNHHGKKEGARATMGASGSDDNDDDEEDIDSMMMKNVSPEVATEKGLGWTLSTQTRKNIQEISNYATDQLFDHVASKSKSGSSNTSTKSSSTQDRLNHESSSMEETNGSHHNLSYTQTPPNPPVHPAKVSFLSFGEWYNSGGYLVVPWLELLDLAKWHYAGRAAEKAAAAERAIEKHQQSRMMNHSGNGNHHHHGSRRSANTSGGPSSSSSQRYGHGNGRRGHEARNSSGGGGSDGRSLGHNGSRSGVGSGMDPIMENFPTSELNPFDSPHPHLDSPPAHSTQQQNQGPSSRQGQGQGQPIPFDRSQPPPVLLPMQPQPRVVSLATFEFAGKKEHALFITDENLKMFQLLVEKSGLKKRLPSQISKILMEHAKPGSDIYQGVDVIHRQDLPAVVRALTPQSASLLLTQEDMEKFSIFFSIFYLTNAKIVNGINSRNGVEESNLSSSNSGRRDVEQVDARELAVGFSFLCAGNKSQKLDETFKIMAKDGADYMSRHNLMRFTRSYLRMLVGISLLSTSSSVNMQHTHALQGSNSKGAGRVMSLLYSADIGANWIVDDFMRCHESKCKPENVDRVTFEDFATWYTEGGFNTAPWLEFLDHKKFVGLLQAHERKMAMAASRHSPAGAFLSPSAPPLNPPTSSGKVRSFDEFVAGSPSPQQRNKTPRSVHAQQQPSPSEKDILSTFPLSNGRNLIVLREDAAYVRAVVEQFGLLRHEPSSVWSKLYSHSQKNNPKPLSKHKQGFHKSGSGKARDVNQKIFVDGVLKSVPAKFKRKRSPLPLAPTPKDTLKFFFLSFDIKEVDRVAVNQLMGGLTLLCGGSKTSKLSFAFSLFDGRSSGNEREDEEGDAASSLCGKEVFYFLRSILIVLFSCCRQSLDLTAGPVGTYIADAANMVTNDIMKYQWRARKVERINFDEFGQWYNEGGFEVAPWLELLDLNKWAFLDKEKAEKMISKAKPMKAGLKSRLQDTTNTQPLHVSTSPTLDKGIVSDFFATEKCPPAPADEDFDADHDGFFDADIGAMEEIDSFDVDFFDQTLPPRDNQSALPDISVSDPMASDPLPDQNILYQHQPVPLTFPLSTNSNDHYTVSVSPRRVDLLKNIILDSGIHEINIANLCDQILGASQGSSITKVQFKSAIKGMISSHGLKKSESFQGLLLSIFDEFDSKKVGKADASELACGLTILCGGRKSDKLEYAFEVLDKMNNGMATRFQMVRYLHSFLTVLLHISSCELGDECAAEDILYASGSPNAMKIDKRLIGWVSSWATEEVFKYTPTQKNGADGSECINFDNFADWYTKGGYNSIAWLELLDLKKWILSHL